MFFLFELLFNFFVFFLFIKFVIFAYKNWCAAVIQDGITAETTFVQSLKEDSVNLKKTCLEEQALLLKQRNDLEILNLKIQIWENKLSLNRKILAENKVTLLNLYQKKSTIKVSNYCKILESKNLASILQDNRDYFFESIPPSMAINFFEKILENIK